MSSQGGRTTFMTNCISMYNSITITNFSKTPFPLKSSNSCKITPWKTILFARNRAVLDINTILLSTTARRTQKLVIVIPSRTRDLLPCSWNQKNSHYRFRDGSQITKYPFLNAERENYTKRRIRTIVNVTRKDSYTTRSREMWQTNKQH